MRAWRFGTASAAVLVGALAIATPAWAGDNAAPDAAKVNAARDHFQKALKLNASGKVDDALREFQTAYDLSPNWRILYNIGQTSRATHDYARSLNAFQRYLSEGGTDVPKARQTEVAREIDGLKGLVGHIQIAAPEGSSVSIDGVVVGKAPFSEAASVNPGRRKITVEHDGQTESKEVEARAGATQEVEFGRAAQATTTTPTPTPSPPVQPEPKPAEPPKKPRDNSTWIAVTGVATGVLALGAGATGTLALVYSNQLKNTIYAGPDHRPAPGTHADALSKRVSTLAIVTDALVAGAIATGGLCIYFIATNSPAPKDEAHPRAGSGSAPKPSAAIGIGPGELVVTGRF